MPLRALLLLYYYYYWSFSCDVKLPTSWVCLLPINHDVNISVRVSQCYKEIYDHWSAPKCKNLTNITPARGLLPDPLEWHPFTKSWIRHLKLPSTTKLACDSNTWYILSHTNMKAYIQSRCFLLGPMTSSVVALQITLARLWPETVCLAANTRSTTLWPAPPGTWIRLLIEMRSGSSETKNLIWNS